MKLECLSFDLASAGAVTGPPPFIIAIAVTDAGGGPLAAVGVVVAVAVAVGSEKFGGNSCPSGGSRENAGGATLPPIAAAAAVADGAEAAAAAAAPAADGAGMSWWTVLAMAVTVVVVVTTLFIESMLAVTLPGALGVASGSVWEPARGLPALVSTLSVPPSDAAIMLPAVLRDNHGHHPHRHHHHHHLGWRRLMEGAECARTAEWMHFYLHALLGPSFRFHSRHKHSHPRVLILLFSGFPGTHQQQQKTPHKHTLGDTDKLHQKDTTNLK